jgi:2-dehydro-3-deoxyphosphooctonate aldolase (KDO 8-P synthase)
VDKMVDEIVARRREGLIPPFLIAGPCVAESSELVLQVADFLGTLCERLNIKLIFKASYTKANRLSGDSYSGPGLDEGLRLLADVKARFNLPILTDVHETKDISAVATVADVIQIPAFLCRQTELVKQAGASDKWVNIKKGQFLAPEDMAPLVAKAETSRVMVTERGSTFGYRSLVVDFRSLTILKSTGAPVIFDATHSLQLPGAGGGVSSGQPQYILPFARAATAIGIDGLFIETHPEPWQAKSDAQAMLPMNEMETLLRQVIDFDRTLTESQATAQKTKPENELQSHNESEKV